MALPRRILPFLLGTLLPAAQGPRVRLQADQVAPGGVLLVVTEPGPAAPVQARLGDKRYAFFPHPADPGHRAAALVPIPFDQAPGRAELLLEGGGAAPGDRLAFTVTRGTFQTIRLSVPKHIAEPSEADKARAAREREEILAIHAAPAPERLWKTAFADPVPGKVTCPYGVKRVFNGAVKSVHKGLDLRAPQGTRVLAPAAGTVRLAKDLFYGGNLVLLDHGCGLFTAYAHLSRIQVAVGQAVKAGELLGLSGATGRVNGPHLHWDASIGGISVDPREIKRCTALLAQGEAPRPRKPAAVRPRRPTSRK